MTADDARARLIAALSDRYRIEREIGAGGMATVYLAEDLRHKRRVALKVLKPELAAVLGADRFVHEITTTASLQHPHILPLFDSGAAGGFLFYVMPFIAARRCAANSIERHSSGVLTLDAARAVHGRVRHRDTAAHLGCHCGRIALPGRRRPDAAGAAR